MKFRSMGIGAAGNGCWVTFCDGNEFRCEQWALAGAVGLEVMRRPGEPWTAPPRPGPVVGSAAWVVRRAFPRRSSPSVSTVSSAELQSAGR